MIKTDGNLNISAESRLIYIGNFFLSFSSQYESKECYAMIKTDENLNISAESWLIWQILPKKWLRLAPNGQFWSFCRFFHLFPQNEAQIDLRMANFTRFTTFPIFYHQSVSFLEKSQKSFLFFEGTSANFLSFSTFSNHFTPERLKMTHNGKFCQKSGLDWLKIANFGHFAGFSIFSPKIRLRLTLNG